MERRVCHDELPGTGQSGTHECNQGHCKDEIRKLMEKKEWHGYLTQLTPNDRGVHGLQASRRSLKTGVSCAHRRRGKKSAGTWSRISPPYKGLVVAQKTGARSGSTSRATVGKRGTPRK